MFTFSKIIRFVKKLFCSVSRRKPKKTHPMEIDEFEYIENLTAFDCQICLSEVKPGDGMVLKDCCHSFCKECITNYIKFAAGPEIPCLSAFSPENCPGKIQDREVRCFISFEDYNRMLERSLNVAELLSNSSYHCKTPNCIGWVEIRSRRGVKFKCPACKKVNCISCEVIHENYTCSQFKALRKADETSVRLINRLVKEKKIMKCPRCGILVEKTDGCNHMTCSKCKCEFQWTGINRVNETW